MSEFVISERVDGKSRGIRARASRGHGAYHTRWCRLGGSALPAAAAPAADLAV